MTSAVMQGSTDEGPVIRAEVAGRLSSSQGTQPDQRQE